MANPGQLGLTPEQKLVVGAGVTPETFGDEKPIFEGLEGRGDNPDPKKEKDKVKLWLERVRIAAKQLEFERERLGVPRFLEEYEGNYQVMLGRMRVPPINEVYSYIQSLISLLINRDPYIAVNAEKTGTIKGAKILEAAVNYFWRELKIKDEVEDELIDVGLAGSAFHKDGVNKESVGSADQLKQDIEKLYSLRVSFRDMVWNIGARKVPTDCQWMAQRIVRPTADVKEQYGARAAGLKGGPHPDLSPAETKSALFKDDLNFSTLWEIWDAMNKQFFLLAENHDKFLRKPQNWPEHMDEFPYSHLYFNRIPDKPCPLPDVAPFEPQILEKIKLVAMALNHVKRWNRQAFVKRGSMRRAEMDKFERGVDGAIIQIDGGAPADVVRPTDYPALQGDVYAILVRLDQIIATVSGTPAQLQGGQAKSPTRTLGELEMQTQGGMNRVQRKVDRVETHVENIARHMIANMKANFDMPTVVKITGMQPQEILQAFPQNADPQTGSIVFTKEDIIGEYDVEVKAGSTLPLNKEGRMAILRTVLEQAARLAQAPSVPPFLQVVIEELLRDLDIKSLEQAFKMQTQAAEQKAKAQAQEQGIESQKTAAEADKRRAQASNIRADTAIETGRALNEANQAGVLPQAIELGRGLGQFPADGEGQ